MNNLYGTTIIGNNAAIKSNGVKMAGHIANKSQVLIAEEYGVSIQQAVKMWRDGVRPSTTKVDNIANIEVVDMPTIETAIEEVSIPEFLIKAQEERKLERQRLAYKTELMIRRDMAKKNKPSILKKIIRELL